METPGMLGFTISMIVFGIIVVYLFVQSCKMTEDYDNQIKRYLQRKDAGDANAEALFEFEIEHLEKKWNSW